MVIDGAALAFADGDYGDHQAIIFDLINQSIADLAKLDFVAAVHRATWGVDALCPAGAFKGPRYAAAMQAQIDTETFADEELD